MKTKPVRILQQTCFTTFIQIRVRKERHIVQNLFYHFSTPELAQTIQRGPNNFERTLNLYNLAQAQNF